MNHICEDDLKVIYKNNKPYGIRDQRGFLFFFSDISKFQGQEERYREEVARQFKLADYLLSKLLMVRELTSPAPATECPTDVVKEVKPETHSVDSTQAGSRCAFESWWWDFSTEMKQENSNLYRACGNAWIQAQISFLLEYQQLKKANDQLFEQGQKMFAERNALKEANDTFARNAIAKPKRAPTAWRSKENYSPDVGSWFEYYDAFREVNDTTGLTPLYE